LADKRQKRKHFLSVNCTFLTVRRQNLSFRIEGFQRVEPVPFLITKKDNLKPSPQRVPTTQAEATAFITAFQEHGRTANRLKFAEHLPQLLVSQTVRGSLESKFPLAFCSDLSDT
jgi:hypothetical protein